MARAARLGHGSEEILKTTVMTWTEPQGVGTKNGLQALQAGCLCTEVAHMLTEEGRWNRLVMSAVRAACEP